MSENKFRKNRKSPKSNPIREQEVANAEEHPIKERTRDFGVPLTDSERELLARAAQEEDRSQRYIARRILIEGLNGMLS